MAPVLDDWLGVMRYSEFTRRPQRKFKIRNAIAGGVESPQVLKRCPPIHARCWRSWNGSRQQSSIDVSHDSPWRGRHTLTAYGRDELIMAENECGVRMSLKFRQCSFDGIRQQAIICVEKNDELA
jgi:hypothetical protein